MSLRALIMARVPNRMVVGVHRSWRLVAGSSLVLFQVAPTKA